MKWPRMLSRSRLGETTIDIRAFDLICLTMAVVLALHMPQLPIWLSSALALILGLRWWQRRRWPGRAPAYLKLPLLGLLTMAVIFQYHSIFGREPGTALAVGLLVLKLLETETPRDAQVSMAFACFALMAALLFNQSMLVTAGVALGLLPALAALRALQPARMATTMPRELLPAFGLLAASLPLTLFAFVLVPRLNSPLWATPPTPQARTGLSEQMSPGDFAELLTDDRPALRVSFDDAQPAPAQRYFRAYVMWRYDGRRWDYMGDPRPPATVESADSIAYRISLEASNQRVLPALDVPLAAPAQARLSADRELIADKPVNEALNYSLRSALHYRLQAELDDREQRRGLQLPADFNPRTRALAAQWRQQFGKNDAAIVQQALTMFHNDNFRYTLSPAPLGRDAMDDFLFTTREGFCEHYASAFTVLMRAAGIPARIVTGYQGGYWNSLGNYLLVRQSDAHAWSEVWLAGRGWVRMDPTAAVRPERVSLGAAAATGDQASWYRNQWLQNLRNRWDIVNHWWNEGIIGFDALRQRGLLVPFGIRDTDTTTLSLLLTVTCVLFAAVGLAWALWRRRRQDALSTAMRTLERKLARVKVIRRLSEGPQHYLSRAARALPHQRRELERLMDAYLSLRYAHDEPPTEPLKAFQKAARNFRPRRTST
ncbi:transglutaminase TgpA family protein [Dyella tabacisoli]|uniref:DUF3488 domain-containing protein n=1 Tax=Dyella tabacisoli TaxID=2282381 RepID=A0A369UK56_9GAMM|nr:DUF3488 and transglutaminase-like domain-containing protein [Dyella tabacisoli]RDD81144.1 DUF3488 domain-containing protein [Dyella tabacisoli]